MALVRGNAPSGWPPILVSVPVLYELLYLTLNFALWEVGCIKQLKRAAVIHGTGAGLASLPGSPLVGAGGEPGNEASAGQASKKSRSRLFPRAILVRSDLHLTHTLTMRWCHHVVSPLEACPPTWQFRCNRSIPYYLLECCSELSNIKSINHQRCCYVTMCCVVSL